MRNRVLIVIVMLVPALVCLAQQGVANDCTPAGVWYGGSVVGYHMTITQSGPATHYSIMAQGMYKNSVMNTAYTGELNKVGNHYEGAMMALSTQDPDFMNPPPIGKLADITAGWSIMEMVDCNTLKNTIPFFGLYVGAFIWQPAAGPSTGGIQWLNGKTPLLDAPDLDLVDFLAGGKPIIETYHRLPKTVNRSLFHPAN